jgi:hypothetical protein
VSGEQIHEGIHPMTYQVGDPDDYASILTLKIEELERFGDRLIERIQIRAEWRGIKIKQVTILDSAVITDGDGKIVYNLQQQGLVGLRVIWEVPKTLREIEAITMGRIFSSALEDVK